MCGSLLDTLLHVCYNLNPKRDEEIAPTGKQVCVEIWTNGFTSVQAIRRCFYRVLDHELFIVQAALDNYQRDEPVGIFFGIVNEGAVISKPVPLP